MSAHGRTTSVSVSLPSSPQSPNLHYRPFHAAMPTQVSFSQVAQQKTPVPNGQAHIMSTATLSSTQNSESDGLPTFCGISLKYVSLLTLAVQNAALTIIMHHSRVSTPPSRAYSAASAVLLNELLKGGVSLAIAVSKINKTCHHPSRKTDGNMAGLSPSLPPPLVSTKYALGRLLYRFQRVGREVFSEDCWKLAIPAVLYVVQNNLQYVAAANLDVATFTVTYQMKILTTAAFSVMLLRKKLGSTKWIALFFLAVGVGVVQLQAGAGNSAHKSQAVIGNSTITYGQNDSNAVEDREAILTGHLMHPLRGFLAVTAACFTSGLAGVYFEMVLKGSKSDLWIRNVQLSLFSLLPALFPIIFSDHPDNSAGWFWDLFRNFGLWAWATVAVQVFGGLVTAVVIKYSDNILKGFATSLSIIISFLASVVLFNFKITPAFLFGSTTVLLATYMYNKPGSSRLISISSAAVPDNRFAFTGSPISPNAPILGQTASKKRSSIAKSGFRSISSVLGFTASHCDIPLANCKTHPTVQHPSYGQHYYSYTPSPSPPSSSPPTRPPSAPRPTLGPLETQNLEKDTSQR